MDRNVPGFSVHGDSPGKNTGVGCHALLRGNLPDPGIKPRSPALQEDSLPSEPPGSPDVLNIDIFSQFCGLSSHSLDIVFNKAEVLILMKFCLLFLLSVLS